MNTLDEIDAMTLQQALQVADDWVSELNNWQELRPRRQRSLARQLHELRAQIEQLKRTHSRVRASRAQITVAIEECVALRREQEAVVARQRQARLDAETLNVQLREACDIARRDSLKIARLSRRLLSLEMAVPSPLIVNHQAFEIVRQDPERQRRRLLQLREDADGMLAMGPLEKGTIDGALELRSILSSRRVAFNCAWIVPFSVDDVAEAAWLQTTRLATGYDSSTQWLDLYGDASSLGSQFVYAAADGVAKYGQIATRRDVLADGTIQLVSTIEVQAIEGGVSVGQFETDIWSRIVPISTNANAPLTQIQWCRRRCYHASQLPRQTVPNPIPLGEYAMFQRNKQAAENALVVKSAQQRMRKGN